ncbi:MAG TPA: hypothetical protein PK202_14255 [Verrucomicrobiota bacterium]|nr:hypothetical protein [Verrucomicrobiota bacterium]HOC52063.1 hypothetical protein [Verrucomicrobiota bacterium]HOX64108.1 hypothetical protein [Verrucomicrobiota bacterium]HPI66453.1 hypothetical protein [Verrucomicrobiota bacterium]HPW92701.1 hypothetical protein [Verrucomicrobiota bacterium]
MNLRQFDLVLLGLDPVLNADFDQVCGGCACGACHLAGIHAAGGNKLSLGVKIGGKHFKDGGHILIGQVAGLAANDAADEAAGKAALASDIALAQVMAFGLALECDTEVAHAYVDGRWFTIGEPTPAQIFFVPCVATYATGQQMQQFPVEGFGRVFESRAKRNPVNGYVRKSCDEGLSRAGKSCALVRVGAWRDLGHGEELRKHAL